MCSSDKDFRYMATNDLMSELQKDAIKLDDDKERLVSLSNGIPNQFYHLVVDERPHSTVLCSPQISAYQKSGTQTQDAYKWDPGIQDPKMSRWDMGPRTPKVGPGTQNPKIFKWDPEPGTPKVGPRTPKYLSETQGFQFLQF